MGLTWAKNMNPVSSIRMGSVLLVTKDDPPPVENFSVRLARAGHHVEWDADVKKALERLRLKPFDGLVLDVGIVPDAAGVCAQARELQPRLSVVMLVDPSEMELAMTALQCGAYDVITKPADPRILLHRIARAVRSSKSEAEVDRLNHALARLEGPPHLVGQSRAMQAVYGLLDRAAPRSSPVLVVGETGTGKGLVARVIHGASDHKQGPLISLNCATVPATMLESELFGHVQGAFTDARQPKAGVLVEASHGTVLLDDIAALPLELQPRLLLALRTGQVRPVGGRVEIPFSTRVISTSHVDLNRRVDDGRFLPELLEWLEGVRIELPPLRERGHDIVVLAHRFLQEYGPLTPAHPTVLDEDATAKLLAYDWPGNVRELEHCVQRAAALAHSEQVVVDDLPQKVREYQSDRMSLSFEHEHELPSLEQLEGRYIRHVLRIVEGDTAKAERILGLERSKLLPFLEASKEASTSV